MPAGLLSKKSFRQCPSAEKTPVRHFLAGAAEVEVDKQGRALIPSKLREFAELTKDVVLVGAAGHIEIWSQERWDALEEEAEESMEDIAERMDDLGL